MHASQTQERYGSFDTLRDVYDISTSCNKADLQVAISGKITVDKIDQVAQTPPDVVVVGSAITKACHPVAAARERDDGEGYKVANLGSNQALSATLSKNDRFG